MRRHPACGERAVVTRSAAPRLERQDVSQTRVNWVVEANESLPYAEEADTR